MHWTSSLHKHIPRKKNPTNTSTRKTGKKTGKRTELLASEIKTGKGNEGKNAGRKDCLHHSSENGTRIESRKKMLRNEDGRSHVERENAWNV